MTLPAMNEVLCGRLPALLVSPDLRRTLAFYRDDWGFDVQHHIPGVIALVNCLAQWHMALQSASAQSPACLQERDWGAEWCLSDCDANRLLLVQSAPHAARRKAQL